MLNVKDIEYGYQPQNQVLKKLSFQLKQGEFLTIAGPNGSGKTTLIKLIIDLLQLQKGKIELDGKSHQQLATKKKITYLASDDYLPEFLTGKEFVRMMCEMYDAAWDGDLFSKLVKFYDFELKIDDCIESYSHGMKKKIQLIMAFIIQAPLLIIDETLNGIDIEAKEITKILLEGYQRNGGTIIFCTHDLDLVQEISQRILLINRGYVATDQTLAEIKAAKSTVMAEFKKLIKFEETAYEIAKAI
jgi:ABC-2 type transport system ATP-binding protein